MVFTNLDPTPLNYYAYADTLRPALSSVTELSDPNLIKVPVPADNLYQKWDGQKWTGAKVDLHDRYGSFRVAMLSSRGWQRIKSITAQDVPEFMGAIAYMDENPNMVKHIWNSCISSLPIDHKPTAAEIAQWQGMVLATEIGIAWVGDRDDAFDITDEGLMI